LIAEHRRERGEPSAAIQALLSNMPLRAQEPVSPPKPPGPKPHRPKPPNISNLGGLKLPAAWTGTHVTDNLGWGTKTAEDILARPGTAVLFPTSGTVLYFHPEGAQGGGSMEIRTDDGFLWWIGHIADGLPAGARVNAGDPIALVSGDHPTPHVHIDRTIAR
jgi:murein DD-endopeptidase MepM/ murein hydrolase activator NlpD